MDPVTATSESTASTSGPSVLLSAALQLESALAPKPKADEQLSNATCAGERTTSNQGDAPAAAVAASAPASAAPGSSPKTAPLESPPATPSLTTSKSTEWNWLPRWVRRKSAERQPQQTTEEEAEAARLAEIEKAKALEAATDSLGGTKHPWLHSVVRFGINRLMDMEEWEEGMEHKEILCREMVTLPTRMHAPDPNAPAAEEEPTLLLEMSHFYPKGMHNTKLPVIIVRTPYDRGVMRHTAERIAMFGYHVIIQDTRNSPNAAALRAKQELAKLAATAKGTSATPIADPADTPTSSAPPVLHAAPQEFFPVVHESLDGLATLDWVAQQPWCDGSISFYGASYLGIAQYAVVDHQHPALKCIVPVVSASRVFPVLFPQPGILNLDLAARWLYLMFHPDVTGITDDTELTTAAPPSFWKRSFARVVGSRTVIPKALDHLPICELDQLVTEKKLSFFQDVLAHASDEAHAFWTQKRAKLCDLANSPPLLIVEGWYDLFLNQALRDYVEALAIHKQFQAEVAQGKYSKEELAAMKLSIKTFKPYLTILNMAHIDWRQQYRISLQESIQWFDFHLKHKAHRLIHRPENRSVRVQMINASGPNEARHKELIEKRKKQEAKLLKAAEKQAAAAAAAVAAVGGTSAIAANNHNYDPSSGPSSPTMPTDPMVEELISPRSKKRHRQALLDAEWRTFEEFPPPQARSVKYYLHAEQDEKSASIVHRLLRTESPAERERAMRMAQKHQDDVGLRAMADALATSAISTSVPGSTAAANVLATSAPQSLLSSFARDLTITPPPPPPKPSAPVFRPTRAYSTYTYDPASPTPSIGGSCFDVENSGPLDNREVEARSDIIVFTSEPLLHPLVVVGFVRCTLYVRSNTPCTDFVARLCDVYPAESMSDRRAGSGKSQILCDGLFKITPVTIDSLTVEKGIDQPAFAASTSASQSQSNLVHLQLRPVVRDLSVATASSGALDYVNVEMTPTLLPSSITAVHRADEPDLRTPLMKLDIDMWATGNVFGVGHRIRFQVCSAAHPRWVRSLGGADPLFCGLDQAIQQHQTIYHDPEHPSCLVLPVLPE